MSDQIIAYCMRCRTKRTMSKPYVYQFKTHKTKHGKDREGMRAIKGTCPVCGTKMFKILSKEDRYKTFDF